MKDSIGIMEADEQGPIWPDGFVEEILTLLDRIECEDNASIAGQRLAIAEKYGMTVVIGEPVSPLMN